MNNRSLIDWVALNLLPGLGSALTRRCLERFGGPHEIAFRVPIAALAAARGMSSEVCRAIGAARPGLRERAEHEIATAGGMGLRLIPRSDPEYPAAIEQISDPPPLLYVWGELPPATVRLAIVGSRRATAYGRRVAVGLAAGLVERGIETVSGGARGIDTCAHVGSLEAGGRTVAVLGSGFGKLYPPENAALFERIAANGAVVSEFPLGMPPLPENFLRRNRLISGLSAAVVVVEAAERSGTISTVGHALEQGREVMAVPGPVSSDQSVGCHRLIQQGAKLVQQVQDILDELSPMYVEALPRPATETNAKAPPTVGSLAPDEARVFELFDGVEPVHLDALCERAPFGIARLQVALFGLEARKMVEQLPGRYYLPRPQREA